MRISIFSLFRDSEDYLERCLSTLDEMEAKTNADFSYFFYENDSIDNTVGILEKWMSSKSGKFKSEKLNAKKFGSVLDAERMILLSNFRNKMLNLDKHKNSDYSVVFDSDINFNSNIINNFLNYKNLNFSMLTSNVRQDVPCKMSSGCQDSYYDSSILFDSNGMNCMTWSDNPFYEDSDREKYTKNEPIKVKRAFGSFGFLKTEYFKHCNWNSKGESEHFSWCDQLSKFAPIYFIPSIRPTVHVPEKTWDHEGRIITHQKKLLENKWNRFLWKTQGKTL